MSENMKTFEGKLQHSGLWWLCWPLVSCIVKSAGILYRAVCGVHNEVFSDEFWRGLQHLQVLLRSSATEWPILIAPALLVCSLSFLDVSVLLVSVPGKTKGVLLAVPQKARKVGHSSHSPFPSEGNSFGLGSSLLVLNSDSLGME